MNPSTKPASFVYAVRAIGTNRIKIGTTKNPAQRLKGIQTSCPFPVEMAALWPGDVDTEAVIHRNLKEHRRQGEWFEVTVEQVAQVAADVIIVRDIHATAISTSPPRYKRIAPKSANLNIWLSILQQNLAAFQRDCGVVQIKHAPQGILLLLWDVAPGNASLSILQQSLDRAQKAGLSVTMKQTAQGTLLLLSGVIQCPTCQGLRMQTCPTCPAVLSISEAA